MKINKKQQLSFIITNEGKLLTNVRRPAEYAGVPDSFPHSPVIYGAG
ncbi:hypothetical protein KP77_12800 [Jeotgalibacillus alimentarius]|uniref:Uncharacterized protein n=1 Tax=Jeotgalibacillus alimentarius TaxID=135826 RepID=A0A0C2RKD6_9BACL|nr:hypothetical protein KP77_12800 [Jeotgalibacillus alimentarius]